MNKKKRVKHELDKILKKHGKLTPRVVLEEAKKPKHPLHNRFTWDDGEAAERWRLAEASQLLRVTFRVDVDGRSADLREYWRVSGTKKSPESHYVPLNEVVEDPVSREIMLRQMFREWKRFKARYQSYAEFIELVKNDPDFYPDQEFGNVGEG